MAPAVMAGKPLRRTAGGEHGDERFVDTGAGTLDRRLAPLAITRPGSTVAALMVAIWLPTITVVWWVYGLQVEQFYPDFVAPGLHRVGTFLDARHDDVVRHNDAR